MEMTQKGESVLVLGSLREELGINIYILLFP